MMKNFKFYTVTLLVMFLLLNCDYVLSSSNNIRKKKLDEENQIIKLVKDYTELVISYSRNKNKINSFMCKEPGYFPGGEIFQLYVVGDYKIEIKNIDKKF